MGGERPVRSDLVAPFGQPPLRVELRRKTLHGGRAHLSALHFVKLRSDHLYRLAERLGDLCRVAHRVIEHPPAIGPADLRGARFDQERRGFPRLGAVAHIKVRRLGRARDACAKAKQRLRSGRCVERLGQNMGQRGGRKDCRLCRVPPFRAPAQRHRRCGRIIQRRQKGCALAGAAELRWCRPCHLQRVCPLERRPGIHRDDGNSAAILKREHMGHACHRKRGCAP